MKIKHSKIQSGSNFDKIDILKEWWFYYSNGFASIRKGKSVG